MPPNPIEEFRNLSERVFACKRECVGIACRPKEGERPRGPLVQSRVDQVHDITLIVGLNPGRPKDDERTILRTAIKHETWQVWCEKNLFPRSSYIQRLSSLANDLGARGSLVWTNIAKCETPEGKRGVPLETLRRCATEYLVQELAIKPKSAIVIAAGREAFIALNYLALDRTIVGVPHPTGAWPQFSRLLEQGSLKAAYIERVKSAQDSGSPSAIWLS